MNDLRTTLEYLYYLLIRTAYPSLVLYLFRRSEPLSVVLVVTGGTVEVPTTVLKDNRGKGVQGVKSKSRDRSSVKPVPTYTRVGGRSFLHLLPRPWITTLVGTLRPRS